MVSFTVIYGDGTVLSNGGTGGTQKTLELENDEYIIQAVIYKNTYKGSDRVFYLELTTDKNRVLESGVKSGTSLTLTAPAGTYIAGFFGWAEANIDKIGAIYKSLE